MKLLDVNVWLAAAWARHARHPAAKHWIDAQDDTLAFCRVTQMALLRLVSNAAVTGPDVRTRRQAWQLVQAVQSDPRVTFLAEPQGIEPVWLAFSKRDDKSHLLWTDDYLAAFAQVTGAELVTLDAGLRTRYPSVQILVLR